MARTSWDTAFKVSTMWSQTLVPHRRLKLYVWLLCCLINTFSSTNVLSTYSMPNPQLSRDHRWSLPSCSFQSTERKRQWTNKHINTSTKLILMHGIGSETQSYEMTVVKCIVIYIQKVLFKVTLHRDQFFSLFNMN